MMIPWQASSTVVQREVLEDENRGPANILVTTVLLAVTTVFVVLRVIARRIKRVWGPEDWYCIAALITLLASGALNYVQTFNGLGRHAIFVPLDQQVLSLKCLLALECLYNITMVLVKISYCYMYQRLFPCLRIHVRVVGWFVVAWGVAFIFACIFQCNPVSKLWEQAVEGTCLDPRPIFVTNAVLNFLSDLALLCMPITQIVGLQMQTAIKVSICSVFILGGFTSVSGLYRIKVLLEVDPTDESWTFVDSNIWTIIEMSCAIISACLPTLRPFLSKVSGAFITQHPTRSGTSNKTCVRQLKSKTTHDRQESDGMDYFAMYSPLSGKAVHMPYSPKNFEAEPTIKASAYELSTFAN